MNRLAKMFALAAPLAAATLLHHGAADACGGCFHPPTSSTVVSGHRMALSVSMQRTVLWDQIEYQGNPEEFSWVLPIKPGARIEEADPAWFEVLDAATLTTVQAPELNCNGGDFSCGSQQTGFATALEDGAGNDNGVTVVKQETVGPYESVTLSSKDPGALSAWLTSHGYDIPADVDPIIGAYVKEGFDFIALRLQPGNGVNLMKPVRVITDGASPVLPLRMVSAGTGPFTSIVLYVIGEGRWETQNFFNAEVNVDDLVWDGETDRSNYAALRTQRLSQAGGLTWLTSYAEKGALLNESYDPNTGAQTGIGFMYFSQILDENGSNYDQLDACMLKLGGATKTGVVADLCDADGVCASPQAGQIDARTFECGTLTDLSTALVGMHPQDVWVTRLEANLPHAALEQDLELRAATAQEAIGNYHVAEKSENYECPGAPPVGPSSKSGKPGPGGNGTSLVVVALGAMATLLAMRRAATGRTESAQRRRSSAWRSGVRS